MAIKIKPIISKIMNVLKKYRFYIKRVHGSHLVINREPPLKRPIIIPNKKDLSNAVRLNLLKECQEAGINKQEFDGIF